MIYTVTFNPALDYVIAVDHFAPGQINRTKEETMVCGGKGINVSALLANLGYESTALGFVAGFTGEEIVRRCQQAGFHSDFIRVKDGLSRINVKMKSDEETEINGMGPDITGKNVELLFEQLNELKAGDVLVLSGSIPAAIDDTIYERIMERLDGRGIRIVVDAEKDLAAELNLENSNFLTPDGDQADGQYSCARDMIRIARECLKNDTIRKLCGAKSYRGLFDNLDLTYKNTNELIQPSSECYYEGAIGMKTGSFR